MPSTLFGDATDAIFESDLALDAEYYPVVGPAREVRLLPAQPVREVGFGGDAVVAVVGQFWVRVSEVARPAAGDVIIVPGERRAVQGDATLNSRRTRWLLDTKSV